MPVLHHFSPRATEVHDDAKHGHHKQSWKIYLPRRLVRLLHCAKLLLCCHGSGYCCLYARLRLFVLPIPQTGTGKKRLSRWSCRSCQRNDTLLIVFGFLRKNKEEVIKRKIKEKVETQRTNVTGQKERRSAALTLGASFSTQQKCWHACQAPSEI